MRGDQARARLAQDRRDGAAGSPSPQGREAAGVAPPKARPGFLPRRGRGLRAALPSVLLLLALAAPAFAVEPDEVLRDPALEERARALSTDLRCLVCQNQSIDDSNAPLARDLRLLVRERLSAGDTDAQVRRFVVDRYGEFVLLRPSVGAHTLLLWLTPLLVLGAGIAGLVVAMRRRPGPPAPLTAEESARLDALLRRDPPAADRAG